MLPLLPQVLEDVDQVLDSVPGIIAKLRALSPFWQGEGKSSASFNPTFA